MNTRPFGRNIISDAVDRDATAATSTDAGPMDKETIERGSGRPFVALSKFVIANDMREQVKDAFVHRPHLVDDAPGFLRMDVISPLENPDEIWLITYWTDQASFQIWHRSHQYHEAHRGIPKGLKLVPRSAEILYFEHIGS